MSELYLKKFRIIVSRSQLFTQTVPATLFECRCET